MPVWKHHQKTAWTCMKAQTQASTSLVVAFLTYTEFIAACGRLIRSWKQHLQKESTLPAPLLFQVKFANPLSLKVFFYAGASDRSHPITHSIKPIHSIHLCIPIQLSLPFWFRMLAGNLHELRFEINFPLWSCMGKGGLAENKRTHL